MHLYSKLQLEIQVALSNYAKFPTTCRELVEQAATLEDNLCCSGGLPLVPQRSSTPRHSTRGSSQASSMGSQRRHPFASPAPRTSQALDKPNTCFHCRGTGHWSRDCFKRRNNSGSMPTTGANSIQSKNVGAQRNSPTHGR